MKSHQAWLAASCLAAVGPTGCGGDHEVNAMTGADGKPTVGISPPGTPTDPKDFHRQQQANDPLTKAGPGYKNSQ